MVRVAFLLHVGPQPWRALDLLWAAWRLKGLVPDTVLVLAPLNAHANTLRIQAFCSQAFPHASLEVVTLERPDFVGAGIAVREQLQRMVGRKVVLLDPHPFGPAAGALVMAWKLKADDLLFLEDPETDPGDPIWLRPPGTVKLHDLAEEAR